jgi:hypothetical protein
MNQNKIHCPFVTDLSHLHRSSKGTFFNASSICCPHPKKISSNLFQRNSKSNQLSPAHVAFPHLEQVVCRHIGFERIKSLKIKKILEDCMCLNIN